MDILGIGNALLDIFCFSDDEIALSFGLHPNRAAHVSPDRLDEFLLAVRSPVFVSGGSASNAVKAASALGAETAFIGCTGTEDREDDEWARLFRADLESFGVGCNLEKRNLPNGRCLVIRMPGNLKSIACSPGAAVGLRPDQLPEDLLKQAKIVLLDGQAMRNRDLCIRLSDLCRVHGITIAVDLASCDIARQFSAETKDMLLRNNTILFMNEDETTALAKELAVGSNVTADGIFSALAAGPGPFPCIIEKRGEKGARAWQDGKRVESETTPASGVLDDTGAGDVFAGAFLRAFLLDSPLSAALAFANEAAALKLSCPGSRLDRDAFSALAARLASEPDRRPAARDGF